MVYNRRLWFALRNKLQDIPDEPGIYLWTREENGITYFYVGQAKNLRNRRTDYQMVIIGKQYPSRHFEASLRKHRDWKFQVIETCNEGMLDYAEQQQIRHYMALPNYVTRNDTFTGIDKTLSNYRRIEQIKNKGNRAIKKCFEYLCITQTPTSLKIGLKMTKKGKPTALSKKYFEKLLEILQLGENNVSQEHSRNTKN